MTVKIQRLIRFDNQAGATFNSPDLAGAIMQKANGKPVRSIKRVFTYGRYPAVSVFGRKYHIHRLLAEFYYRPLKRLESVHHKDGNRLNSAYDNLEIIDQADHVRHHLHKAANILDQALNEDAKEQGK